MKTLILDLDLASIRYTKIRLEYLSMQIEGTNLSEIEEVRTKAHDALIACFNSVLRNIEPKPEDMVKACVNRVEIGKWAINRALLLINGTKTFGNI